MSSKCAARICKDRNINMPASELRPPQVPFPGLPIIAITHVLTGPFGMNIFNDLGGAASRLPQITGSPLLGEHTDEVLSELGYSAKQIAELHRKKVVGSSGLSRHHHDIIRALQEKGTAHGD